MIRVDDFANLDNYVGKRVTVQSTTGAQYRGKLDSVNESSVTLKIDGQLHRVLTSNIRDFVVNVGGDWVSYSGHSERSRTRRLAVRLSAEDDELVKDTAAMRDMSVSDYLRYLLHQDIGVSQEDGRRRGSRHPSVKLTAEQVESIRADERSHVEVAREFGVTPVHVARLRKGEHWGEEQQHV